MKISSISNAMPFYGAKNSKRFDNPDENGKRENKNSGDVNSNSLDAKGDYFIKNAAADLDFLLLSKEDAIKSREIEQLKKSLFKTRDCMKNLGQQIADEAVFYTSLWEENPGCDVISFDDNKSITFVKNNNNAPYPCEIVLTDDNAPLKPLKVFYLDEESGTDFMYKVDDYTNSTVEKSYSMYRDLLLSHTQTNKKTGISQTQSYPSQNMLYYVKKQYDKNFEGAQTIEELVWKPDSIFEPKMQYTQTLNGKTSAYKYIKEPGVWIKQ